MSIQISRPDVGRISFDDVLSLLNREGGILIEFYTFNIGDSYAAYFPSLEEGDEAYVRKMEELRGDEMFKNKQGESTGISRFSWGYREGVPDD